MSDDIVYGWHFLSSEGTAHGGYVPPAVGIWEPPIKNPEPCIRGYHGSPTILDALKYSTGPILGRCEYRGIVWHGDRDKWAARERRCIARVDASAFLRLAACHFAEEAIEKAGITDERSRNAIVVARRFALGLATVEEMYAAHSAAYAAGSAAGSAAHYAAYYAACDAGSAGSAAHYAAYYAACDAAYFAERKLQSAWLESAALDLDTAPAWTK